MAPFAFSARVTREARNLPATSLASLVRTRGARSWSKSSSPKLVSVSVRLITDRNAASDYATFLDPLPGVEQMRFDLVYARYWAQSGDPIIDIERKSIKNAEVLVPDSIPSSYIRSAFVYNEDAKAEIASSMEGFDVKIRPELYF